MSDYFEPWLSFKNPIVRQLAFVVASPNIIHTLPQELHIQNSFRLHDDSFWIEHYQRYEFRLLELDKNPQEIIDFMSQLKSTRLGLRFEYLMWFWLKDHEYHHYQLIDHSIQIIEGKNTLGELDFLVLNRSTNEIEHWEIALKYYLGEANLCLPHWYGLNRSDTLNRKLNHFSQKQFQFESAQGHTIQKRMCVLKGQLYLPSRYDDHNIPKWINPSRRIGSWGHQILTHHYYRLKRQEWICTHPQQSSEDAIWWCNGLYRNFDKKHDYMFRQAPVLSRSVT